MKRSITIVTWIGSGNFGTSLQSFALHCKLEKMGYEVRIVREFPSTLDIKALAKNVLSRLGLYKSFKKSALSEKQYRKFVLFQKACYNVVDVFSKSQLRKLIHSTDVFITGSDQIWNTRFALSPHSFLDFAESKKRVAYASSIGLDDFPEEHKPIVKAWLSEFSHIGVREKTGKEILERLLPGKRIYQVLDPTLLLTADEWRRMSADADLNVDFPKRYILCYLIGARANYAAQLERVKAETGITAVLMIPSVEHPAFSLKGASVYSEAGPKEFVKLLSEASYICTDSFHATALAINFSRPFVEFMRFDDCDSASQNSRIYDILGRYSLMSRIYSECGHEWAKETDYPAVTRLLAKDRAASTAFLSNSIEH